MAAEHSDAKIYQAYRGVLRKQTAVRAALRRNAARRIIVERYGVSFADLKAIVSAGDEANGVDHPDSPEYLSNLRFDREEQELIAKHGSVCPECNEEDKKFVRARIDSDLVLKHRLGQQDPELVYSCFDCYLARGKSASLESSSIGH